MNNRRPAIAANSGLRQLPAFVVLALAAAASAAAPAAAAKAAAATKPTAVHPPPSTTSAAPAIAFSGNKIVFTAEQAAGGHVVDLSTGAKGVCLDRTCAASKDVSINWRATPPLPAGWWHGTVSFCPKEKEEQGWSNHNLSIVLLSPRKPSINMMANFRQDLELWIYSSAPADGVRIQPVYNDLWKYKRTWPILQVTLEQVSPASLTPQDVLTLDLPVAADGSVALPAVLPSGLWSANAAVKKSSTLIAHGDDGRDIRGPFSFDYWKRPSTLFLYAQSSLRQLTLQADPMVKTITLQHGSSTPWKEETTLENQPLLTVDPARPQTAELQLLGTNLSAEAPTFPLLPGGCRTAVVTSWDDGPKEDLRLAEMLHRYGYHPSFFLNNNNPAMKFLDKLEALDVEVGSHCYSHPFLYSLPPERATWECVEMRKLLEKELKHPVISMAYPNGYFASYDADGDYVLRAVKAAGYWSGRTTMGGSETVESLGDLLTLKTDGFFADYEGLKKAWEKTRAKEGGIFYFWGHSWQIGGTDAQWQKLEEFVAQFARQPDTWYPSQGELSLWLWARKSVNLNVVNHTPSQMTVKLTRPGLHPYLAARSPLSLKLPPNVQSVRWRGAEVPIKNGYVQLDWPGW